MGLSNDGPDIALAGRVEFNALIWISSLRESEVGTTRRVIEDLDQVLRTNEWQVSTFEPNSRDHLLQFLESVSEQAKGPLKPIIHLDMHGDEEQGLFIAATGEFLPWETLLDRFRAINAGTDNNLCVIAPVCHAYHAILKISLDHLTPFNIFIAPVKEVTGGFIEESIVPFYREMFSSEDIIKAFRQHLQAHLDLFSAQRIFVRILVDYIVGYCSGQALQTRKENLLTAIFDEGGIPRNRHNLRKLRADLRAALKPKAALIEKYAGRFLNRPDPGIDIGKIVALARKKQQEENRKRGGRKGAR